MVFAQTLERVLSLQRDDPGRLRHRAKQAADFIAQNYLPAREEDELLAAWPRSLPRARNDAERSTHSYWLVESAPRMPRETRWTVSSNWLQRQADSAAT